MFALHDSIVSRSMTLQFMDFTAFAAEIIRVYVQHTRMPFKSFVFKYRRIYFSKTVYTFVQDIFARHADSEITKSLEKTGIQVTIFAHRQFHYDPCVLMKELEELCKPRLALFHFYQ